MGLFGDRYAGTYEGHVIELIRNNWDKTLKLLIDGEVVDGSLRHFPRTITLTGAVEHNGVKHTVVARSTPHYFIFTRDIIEIDGNPLTSSHEAPKGITPAWAVALIALAGAVAVAGAGVGVVSWLRE